MTIYVGKAKLTLTRNVNVRKLYPYGTIIGAVRPGQSFKADELRDGWFHVIEVGGNTPSYGSGWADSSLFEFEAQTDVPLEEEILPTLQPVPSVVFAITFDQPINFKVSVNGVEFKA